MPLLSPHFLSKQPIYLPPVTCMFSGQRHVVYHLPQKWHPPGYALGVQILDEGRAGQTLSEPAAPSAPTASSFEACSSAQPSPPPPLHSFPTALSAEPAFLLVCQPEVQLSWEAEQPKQNRKGCSYTKSWPCQHEVLSRNKAEEGSLLLCFSWQTASG